MSNDQPQPPATIDHMGPFTLTTRMVTDDQGDQWLEAEMVLTSGRLRLPVATDDGNAVAHARSKAIDLALQSIARDVSGAIQQRDDQADEEK